MMRRDNSLFSMAQTWLNVPFRWHGYSKFGCDCVGLIAGVLYENDIIDNQFMNEFCSIRYGTNLSNVNYKDTIDIVSRFFYLAKDIINSDLLLVKTNNSPIHFIIFEKEHNHEVAKIIHMDSDVKRVVMTNFDHHISVVNAFF